MPRLRLAPIAMLLAAALIAGCGSSNKSSSSSGTSPAAGGGAGALSAEAQSAATGDIPDNQVYLRFASPAGYSILYPEGWTRKGGESNTVFAAKNNIIRIVLGGGAAPTPAAVSGELAGLKRSGAVLSYTAPRVIRLKGGSAVKATYTSRSAPNAVTGKVVVLTVDRYELSRGGRVVTLDLATPKGVDTVDAYRMISNSFRWR